MLRQVKPRSARTKRILEAKAPKAVENPKKALLLRGTSCSQIIQDLMTDLHQFMPGSKKFTKKNAIHPFEDASSLEFFSEKNDTSLLVFGSSSKKRPHTLTLARTFDAKLLDMLELHLEAGSFRTLNQFHTAKFAVGTRPMLVFAGTAFESPVPNEWTLVKSLLTDLLRGEPSDKIDVEGLSHVVFVSADEPSADAAAANSDDPGSKPALRLRVYMVKTRRSGQRLPRVELEECGPRADFRLGRVREADASVLKEAMRQPRGAQERTKKNVSTDPLGDKVGRLHLGKQDMSQLQTRKMKGLKKRGRDDAGDEAAGGDDGAASGDDPKKKKKVA